MDNNRDCYAVIFTAHPAAQRDSGYAEMAQQLRELATLQPGFLGFESVGDDELEISVSYWETREAIEAWQQNELHRQAQKFGREEWYRSYSVRVCKVERAYATVR